MTFLRGLFLLSGAAGLIYEVVWTRLFSDVVGSTAIAMSAVFSVFLLGLALGAGAAGRIQVFGRRAIVLYGWLEIAIAVSASATSLALLQGRSYLAQLGPGPDSLMGSIGYSVGLSALLMGVPTMLMGATLPFVLNGVRQWVLPHRVVAQLYGWNTLGAAVGTLLAGFVLIWKFGLIMTLGTAVVTNLVVGLVVVLLHTRFLPDSGSTVQVAESPESVSGTERLLWTGLAFASGFVVIAYEMLWGRIAKFMLGDRTMAIAALLFGFIACLGLGSLLAPAVGRRFRARSRRGLLTLVGLLFTLGAVLHVLVVPVAASVIGGQGLPVISLLPSEFTRRIAAMWVLIGSPVLTLGLVFPLLAWSARTMDDRPGRTLGSLYMVNTIGAALGAITGGMILVGWVGTMGGFLVISAALAAAGCGLLLAFGSTRLRGLAIASMVLLVAGWMRFPGDLVQVRPDERLLLAGEDAYGVQVLARTDEDYLRVRNNRLSLIFDLGHPQTTHAQQMAAHLTALLAADVDAVLNVGTGYGITAGTYTLYPIAGMETIEILPFLVENQSHFSNENFGYVTDDRVTALQGDGRHWLASRSRDYDIISVNVLDPYLPGSSSLYTVDFWELAFERLRPGGVYTQLFWGADLGLLVKGLQSVFPTVLYFPAYGGTSYNVVAFRDPVTREELLPHIERLGPRATQELRRVLGDDPIGVFNRSLAVAWDARPDFQRLAEREQGRLHSDNFPILEFRWAHGVGGVSLLDSPLVQY